MKTQHYFENGYASPQAWSLEMYSEGVLCSSTEDLIEKDDWLELLED